MNEITTRFKKLAGTGGLGILGAVLLIIVCVALVLAIVGVIMAAGWALGAYILGIALDLVGYPVTYKVAYGLSMLSTMLTGIFGGIRVNYKK